MNPANSTADIGNAERERAATNQGANALFGVNAAAQDIRSGNRNCSDKPRLAANALLLPGLGCARLSKDGETVLELQALDGVQSVSVNDAERLALAEPEHDWCIHMVGLLEDRHYRREGAGLWRLYARGYGLS